MLFVYNRGYRLVFIPPFKKVLFAPRESIYLSMLYTRTEVNNEIEGSELLSLVGLAAVKDLCGLEVFQIGIV